MKATHIVGAILLGTLSSCSKPPADTKPAASDQPVTASANQDPPAAEPPAAPAPAAEQPAAPAPAEPAPAEPAPAAAASEEFGVKDCDEYMKRAAVCDPYRDHPNVGKIIIDKWRRLKAEGNIKDLETLCSRALMLYECKPK